MKIKKLGVMIFAFFVSFMMTMVLSTKNVKAMYFDLSENKLLEFSTSRQDSSLKISIQYQNGIRRVEAYICEVEKNTSSACMNASITHFRILTNSEYDEWIINKSDTSTATYNQTFTTPYGSGTSLANYNDTETNEYKLVVTAHLCETHTEDGNGCASTYVEGGIGDVQGFTVLYFDTFVLDKSFTGSGEVNSTIYKILNVLNTVVIPVLWVIMGVLLLVRGIMLGIAIMKNGDEPEIRKKKIQGLIWLFIGIGIGYLITIVASAVMGMFGYGGLFS